MSYAHYFHLYNKMAITSLFEYNFTVGIKFKYLNQNYFK